MLRTAPALLILAWAVSGTADELVLANGDTLNGEVVERAVDYVILDHPQLGRIRLARDQLEVGKPPKPGLFGTPFLRGWKRRIEFGLNGERGNDFSNNLTAALDFSYTDDWARWKIDGRYLLSEDESNSARLDLGRDWLDPNSKWFRRLLARYQFDAYESWKHRLTAFGGGGYHLVETTLHQLDVAVGPGFIREFGESQDNRGLAVLSLDYTWEVSNNMELRAINNFFYELVPDLGHITNFSRLVWSTTISRRAGLSLNLSVENEYESRPAEDDKADDLKYFLTIGLDL